MTISLSKKITSALLFLSLSTANSLFATDLDLSLQVTGTILAAPAWKDTSASTISSVAFNFGSLIAGQAATNVDSAALSVVLTDPSNSGSVLTVAITTPSSCTIGGDSITNSHVVLVYSSTEFANSANLSLSEGATNSLVLRFVDDGTYGDKTGAVSCSNNGSLTYTY